MRRKEYAVSLGLATAGKGRMSREALAAIDKARAEGMTFSDDDVAPRAPKAPRKAVEVTARAPKANAHEREFGLIDSTRYPMDQKFKGVDSLGKTHIVGGANACGCGYSLVGHICNTPTALIGYPLERINVVPV
jgi:hypothetical protein